MILRRLKIQFRRLKQIEIKINHFRVNTFRVASPARVTQLARFGRAR
jgi:hypothetical protein